MIENYFVNQLIIRVCNDLLCIIFQQETSFIQFLQVSSE